MSEYQCTNCDAPFVHEGHGRLRCPRCLRQNGLLPLEEASAAPKQPGRRRGGKLVIALVVCALALAAGAGLLLHKRKTELPAPGQLAALDAATLRATLVKRGVPADLAAVSPLKVGEAVEALAGGVDGDDPAARARAVAAAVVKAMAGRRPLLSGQPGWAAREPEALLTLNDAPNDAPNDVGKGARGDEVTSLELCALLVAALRAADLPAVLAERFKSSAPAGVADVSGVLGRYAAVVYRPGELGGEPLLSLDPMTALELPAWAREPDIKAMAAPREGLKLLGDASAAAHLLSLRALQRGKDRADRAYAQSGAAVAAAAPSATLQLARAQVLATAGGTRDAVSAARKALTLREDAPRMAGLARLLLAQGDVEHALGQLRRAVIKTPGHWPSRVLLATVLAAVDPEKSDEQLQKALEVAPDAHEVLLLDGMTHLSRGMPGQAADRLKRVAAALPGSLEVHLLLYHALGRASRDDEAARVRKKILDLAPDREEMGKRLDMIDRGAAGGSAGGAVADPPRELKLPDVTLSQ